MSPLERKWCMSRVFHFETRKNLRLTVLLTLRWICNFERLQYAMDIERIEISSFARSMFPRG